MYLFRSNHNQTIKEYHTFTTTYLTNLELIGPSIESLKVSNGPNSYTHI